MKLKVEDKVEVVKPIKRLSKEECLYLSKLLKELGFHTASKAYKEWANE